VGVALVKLTLLIVNETLLIRAYKGRNREIVKQPLLLVRLSLELVKVS
jgi:hypothetical protein